MVLLGASLLRSHSQKKTFLKEMHFFPEPSADKMCAAYKNPRQIETRFKSLETK